VSLHAQTPAIEFYLRHGFQPYGERFWEPGIEHQSMRRVLGGPTAIDHRDTAISTIVDIIGDARRCLWLYTRDLDPGLLDAPPVLDALRRFGTAGRGNELRVLLQDAARAATRPRAAARAGATPAERLPVPRSRRSGRPGLSLGVPRQRPRGLLLPHPGPLASTAKPTCMHRARAAVARGLHGGVGTRATGQRIRALGI
jgi:hypothetical protein